LLPFEFYAQTLEITEVYVVAWNVGTDSAFATLGASETEVGLAEDGGGETIGWSILVYLLDDAHPCLQLTLLLFGFSSSVGSFLSLTSL
jgi:hypothetical protein